MSDGVKVLIVFGVVGVGVWWLSHQQTIGASPGLTVGASTPINGLTTPSSTPQPQQQPMGPTQPAIPPGPLTINNSRSGSVPWGVGMTRNAGGLK